MRRGIGRTVIGNDFDTVVLPDSNAAREKEKMSRWRRALEGRKNIRVGGTKINANGTVKQIFGHFFVEGKREG